MIKVRKSNERSGIGYVILGIFVLAAFLKFLGSHPASKNPTANTDVIEHSESASVTPLSLNKLSRPAKTQSQENRQASAKVETFRRELSAVLNSFPTKRSLQGATTADIHITPESIIQAAIQLGEVTDKMEADPELRTAALDFYSRCATMNDGVPAIQAVCLKRARQVYGDLQAENNQVAVLALHVSSDVEKLAW